MKDKKSSETAAPTAEAAPAKSGGMLRTVMIVFLLLGIAAIGYVMGGRGGAAPAATGAAPAAAEAEVEKEKEKKGPVVSMEPINVNLAEGHYLRIAVALGLSYDVKLKDPKEFDVAAASDVVLSTFSGMAMADLTSSDGREKVRKELLESLEYHYGEEVVKVYFTEFVMQ
jgi:flagellar FliL protein